jgi:hypothetical protein
MAFQFSDTARNGIVNAIATAGGSAPTLEIRSGAVPANCAAAASGTVLVTMTLPATWMNGGSGGVATLAGTWQDLLADVGGTAGHFRIRQGATTHIQGTVTATGGGGDMTLDNPVITLNQQVTITSFTLTAGGA